MITVTTKLKLTLKIMLIVMLIDKNSSIKINYVQFISENNARNDFDNIKNKIVSLLVPDSVSKPSIRVTDEENIIFPLDGSQLLECKKVDYLEDVISLFGLNDLRKLI